MSARQLCIFLHNRKIFMRATTYHGEWRAVAVCVWHKRINWYTAGAGKQINCQWSVPPERVIVLCRELCNAIWNSVKVGNSLINCIDQFNFRYSKKTCKICNLTWYGFDVIYLSNSKSKFEYNQLTWLIINHLIHFLLIYTDISRKFQSIINFKFEYTQLL